MTHEYRCAALGQETQGALAAYLYGECDAAERAAMEAHLAACSACAAELASLGAAKSALASWVPPETELGFQIVSATATLEPASNVVRPSRWWQQPLPAWAQAAAALLIFAVGGLLGMRAGSEPAAPATTTVSAPAASVATAPVERFASAPAVSAEELAALERRLRGEIAQLRTASGAQPAQASAADEQILQRVRALLEDSERRQQRELAFRLSQLVRDVDAQRRMDLARIEQTFGQIEGMTGPELRQQRQAIDYLIRTAAQRPQE
jgi:anti-sigma factor RsiW